MARIGIPRPHKDSQCQRCDLVYGVDIDGNPKTRYPYTCDDCDGAVEVVEDDGR